MAEFNDRTWNPAFYLVIFVFLFPFSGWFPKAIRKAWADRKEGRFLILWLFAPVLIFTFYQTQLPHYILPGYGGALLLIFGYLNRNNFERSKFALFLGWVFLVLGFLVAGLVILSNPPEALMPLKWAFASFALIAWALVALQRGLRTGNRSVMAVGVILLAVGFSAFGRSLRSGAVSIEIGQLLESSSAEVYWGIGYGEPSLVYYTHRFWDFPTKDEWTKIAPKLDDSPAGVIVVKRREWRDERLLRLFYEGDWEAAGLSDQASVLPSQLPESWTKTTLQGLNLARFSWVELEVWERRE
jgi:4-amino-4-deoxy-L-arabinose transferase-like glycosyltransferase